MQILFLICFLFIQLVQGYKVPLRSGFPQNLCVKSGMHISHALNERDSRLMEEAPIHRQVISSSITLVVNAIAATIIMLPLNNAVIAADVMYYKSGKAPVPVAMKDSKTSSPSSDNEGSKVGTKKDSTFLRCMSNCKTECQAPSAGLAKVDCFQDCQDQCCSSYEQCSFKPKQTRSSIGG